MEAGLVLIPVAIIAMEKAMGIPMVATDLILIGNIRMTTINGIFGTIVGTQMNVGTRARAKVDFY